MLRKSNRFHGPKAVGALVRRGKTQRSKNLSVRKKSATKWRVAVVVKKKLYKSAVGRNSLRRRIFAITRECIESGEFEAQNVVFFVNSTNTHELSYEDLKSEVQSLLA